MRNWIRVYNQNRPHQALDGAAGGNDAHGLAAAKLRLLHTRNRSRSMAPVGRRGNLQHLADRLNPVNLSVAATCIQAE